MRLAWTLALLPAVLACGEDPPRFDAPDEEVCLDRRDGARYCIDRFEASRRDATAEAEGVDDASPPRSLPDRRPWAQVTWAAARAACEARGKRLCELDEWVDACDGALGADGLAYPYGDVLDPGRCNVGGQGVRPGGALPGCASLGGVLDLAGNVWEWTGNAAASAAARGGSFRSSQAHRCRDQLMGATTSDSSPEVGFRCCRSL
jgi:formylglycine-generating enzyme required for sulfatase activity